MNDSIMVVEANIDELVRILEDIALSIKSLRISRLIIDYVDETNLSR